MKLCDYEPSMAMFMAIFDNRLDDVAHLAEQGLYNVDIDGDTAFMYAIDKKNYRAARILLDKGADPNQKNSLGDNALHLAAKWNIRELLNLMLDYDIDLDAIGQDGFTAINYALAFGNYDIAKKLAQRGANLDIKDDVYHMSAAERAKRDGTKLQ